MKPKILGKKQRRNEDTNEFQVKLIKRWPRIALLLNPKKAILRTLLKIVVEQGMHVQ